MHKKKGSLSLSINAIVVLILAITMLGLGLGFIRGMFGKVSTMVEEQIANEPEAPTATASEPLTVSTDTKIIEKNQKFPLKFSMYNPGASDVTSNLAISGCSGFTITVGTPSVPVRGVAKATALVTPTADYTGTTICTFKAPAVNSDSAEVVVTVR